jgi:hypothetical protein
MVLNVLNINEQMIENLGGASSVAASGWDYFRKSVRDLGLCVGVG